MENKYICSECYDEFTDDDEIYSENEDCVICPRCDLSLYGDNDLELE